MPARQTCRGVSMGPHPGVFYFDIIGLGIAWKFKGGEQENTKGMNLCTYAGVTMGRNSSQYSGVFRAQNLQDF